MKKIFILFILTLVSTAISAESFPIPKNNIATFDIIRKNKVIGFHEIKFNKKGENLTVETTINIEVKVLFIPAYKFTHKSKEYWIDEDFIKIDAHTDFEDEREYFITGAENEDSFIATGMDGEVTINKSILPSNFWNIKVLDEEKLFDTQKGIIRSINVNKLGNETIEINKTKYNTKKYTLNASSNPKDKGPFPEYTLWYSEENELLKFKFKNWKDKKIVTIVRNDI
tara:strand:- start:615 stop:1295 length:681 start_codon:yes stop_codon:yes gene_type:complete